MKIDSIFLFRRKPGTATAFILEKWQGKPFAPLQTENSKGEKVCYLTKIQGKANANRKPSWNVSISKNNAKKLGLKTDNLSGIFIPLPEAANRGFGDCKFTGNGYLFLLGENLETLTILVFENQCSTVEQALFTRFLDGEFDAQISEFLQSQTQ